LAGVGKGVAGDEKAVFGAVGEGGDFGVEQADVVLGEDFGEVGEQVGAVGGDDLDGVAVGFFFGLDADAGGKGEQAGAAAGVGTSVPADDCLAALPGRAGRFACPPPSAHHWRRRAAPAPVAPTLSPSSGAPMPWWPVLG